MLHENLNLHHTQHRMNYCINPNCSNRQNSESAKFCQTCGTQLLIHDNRCRLIKPLRSLDKAFPTEIFEVEYKGTLKVLKVLKEDTDSLKLVELFEQEVRILTALKHPGIPKAELKGYFTFSLSNGQELHCLLMEKIEGQNLEQWLKAHGAISEKQALKWLRQLLEILRVVHENHLFHRDIKPSNIMLRNTQEQLVLIDFGTARKVTETVINGQNVTVIYSHGYTAPEQIEGNAVPQSDFFALGRTFVHLLTGIAPDELSKNKETNQIIWRNKTAKKISNQFADLIDNLMARSPRNRPQDAKVILQRLDAIEKSTFSNLQPNIFINKWLIAGLISSSVLVAVIASALFFPKAKECFTNVSNVPAGVFNYGGSTTWAPIRLLVDSAINKAFPEFGLRYEQPTADEGNPGSSTGIKMLLKGRLSIAQSSRPFLEKENQQAQQQGFTLIHKSVGIDAVAVAVNPRINIPGLTVAQLKNIYLGKIRNWQQVGGPNLEIIPYSRLQDNAGTVDWFIDSVLQNQPFSNNVKFVSDTTQGLRKVATELGGIYYASAPEVVPQCTIRPLPISFKQDSFIPPYQEPFIPSNLCLQQTNKVNQKVFKNGKYPLTRNLFVIFKDYPEENNIDEKAGRAYANLLLTDEGQNLIEKAGFVRIRFGDNACLPH